MRKLFEHYHRPTEEEFKEHFKTCLFVFDANFLLHVYRWSDKSVEDLFNTLEPLKNRIWISHQTANEFYRNRLSVKHTAISIYGSIKNEINAASEKIRRLHANFEATIDYAKKLDAIASEIDTKMSSQKFSHDDDEQLRRLNILFENCIGDASTETELKKLLNDVSERYKIQKPPGFKDKDRLGDGICWLQLMNHLKKNTSIRSVIFVTDDGKEDWWDIVGGETIGPNAELRKEMKEECNVWYFQYKSHRFLNYCKDYLHSKVSDSTIKEAKNTASTPTINWRHSPAGRWARRFKHQSKVFEDNMTRIRKLENEIMFFMTMKKTITENCITYKNAEDIRASEQLLSKIEEFILARERDLAHLNAQINDRAEIEKTRLYFRELEDYQSGTGND